jgi:hypothetical protein
MTRRTGYVKGVTVCQCVAPCVARRWEAGPRPVSYGAGPSVPVRAQPCSASHVTGRPRPARASVEACLVWVSLLEHLDRPATIRGTELAQHGRDMAAHGHL